jgi:hypothetical protein
MKHAPWMTLLTLMMLVIVACDSRDQRLAEFAQRSAAEQAAQNRAAAELATQAAENQRRTVEVVEKSRQDLIAQQKDSKSTSTNSVPRSTGNAAIWLTNGIGKSMLAPVLTSIGFLLVTALPLVLCWYLLHSLKDAPVDETSVTQLLVQDLVSDQPILLPPPVSSARHITHSVPEPPKIEEQPPSAGIKEDHN